MDVAVVMQVVTPLLAVVGIVWHQQHSIDKLRDDFNEALREQRDATDKLPRRRSGPWAENGPASRATSASGMPTTTDGTDPDGEPPDLIR